MSDIVERLLDTGSIYPVDLLRKEAAAEIERLKVHNHHLECVIETQDAEIERLRAAIREMEF